MAMPTTVPPRTAAADALDAGAVRGPETSPTGHWAFLDEYIEDWFSSLMYAVAPTSTIADPRFDTFLVHLPATAATAVSAGNAGNADGTTARRRLFYATQLVAYMLTLDKETWWYAKRRPRPWFGEYAPSQYDPTTLVPKMTFACSRVLQRSDDDLGAVRQLHAMLLDNDHTSVEYVAFRAARQRILEMDEDYARQLRGFRVPTQLRLQPPRPQHADELRMYLRDVLTLVRALLRPSDNDDEALLFRLDAVALNVYVTFLSDVHIELRELLSLGVPVTISLRHGVTGGFIPDTIEWTVDERANVFAVVADDPRQFGTNDTPIGVHTLDSKWISNSCELWSAVAYASSLRKVRVQPTEFDNAAYNNHVARWMALALAQNRSLESLEIVRFRMTPDELDALETELRQHWRPASHEDAMPTATQLVRLQPNAVVETRPGGEINGYDDSDDKPPEQHTLAQLNIPETWWLPVVSALDDETSETIQVLVPGHAVGTVARSSVASYQETVRSAVTLQAPTLTSLRSLVLHNEVWETGLTARFVRLVGGHGLRELRWYGEYMGAEHGLELQADLDAIATACPTLQVLAIEDTQLASLASLAVLPLRELSLLRVPVPQAALVAFLSLLHDHRSPLAQTLTRFSYYCPLERTLSVDVVDAATEMLQNNHQLYTMSLGVVDDAITDERFGAAGRGMRVTVERLSLRSKLAFLSVVQCYHTQQPARALGQLDDGCVATVFQCLGRVATRRLRLLRSEPATGTTAPL